MSRIFRTSVGANFVLAAVLVLAWIVYGALSGLPINQNCMGFRHGWRMLDGPAWVAPMLIELVFLGLFFLRGYLNEYKIRLVIGGASAWCLLFGLGLPLLLQQVYGTEFFSWDRALWWYVCLSNIAYAVMGTNRSD